MTPLETPGRGGKGGWVRSLKLPKFGGKEDPGFASRRMVLLPVSQTELLLKASFEE